MNKVDKINEGIIDLKERKLQMTEDNIQKKEIIKDFTNVFCQENYYYEIQDINIPLKNVLDGKEVYEYPQFYLFQKE